MEAAKKIRCERVKEVLVSNGDIEGDEEETEGQRRYFEGCLVKLFVFYHGKNWKDSKVCQDAREDIKLEFNGETRENMFTGKVERHAKSTKGKAVLAEVVLQTADYLTENFRAPFEALDSESYKAWRDGVKGWGDDDDYISYLLANGVLRLPNE